MMLFCGPHGGDEQPAPQLRTLQSLHGNCMPTSLLRRWMSRTEQGRLQQSSLLLLSDERGSGHDG